MTFLTILAAIFGYFVTGAFFCGIADDDDYLWAWMWLWPIMIVLLVILRFGQKVCDLGYDFRDTIQSYFEKE